MKKQVNLLMREEKSHSSKTQNKYDDNQQVSEDDYSEDLLDILFNQENKDPILLIDNEGRKIAFEQVAIIPFQEKIYAILKPIQNIPGSKIEGVADDEAIVFYLEESDEELALQVETNQVIAIEIFHEYYNLLEEKL